MKAKLRSRVSFLSVDSSAKNRGIFIRVENADLRIRPLQEHNRKRFIRFSLDTYQTCIICKRTQHFVITHGWYIIQHYNNGLGIKIDVSFVKWKNMTFKMTVIALKVVVWVTVMWPFLILTHVLIFLRETVGVFMFGYLCCLCCSITWNPTQDVHISDITLNVSGAESSQCERMCAWLWDQNEELSFGVHYLSKCERVGGARASLWMSVMSDSWICKRRC